MTAWALRIALQKSEMKTDCMAAPIRRESSPNRNPAEKPSAS